MRSLPNSNHRAYCLAYEWPGPLGTLPLCQKLLVSPQISYQPPYLKAKAFRAHPLLETGENYHCTYQNRSLTRKMRENNPLLNDNNQKQLSSQVSFPDLLNDSFNLMYIL